MLKAYRSRCGTSPGWALDQDRAERVVHAEELARRDRAAAILALIFGQQIEDVVALTWDDVKVSDEIVTVCVGKIDIALPKPLDQPLARTQRLGGVTSQEQLGVPPLKNVDRWIQNVRGEVLSGILVVLGGGLFVPCFAARHVE